MAASSQEELAVLDNLKRPIFEKLCKRVKTCSGASLITPHNGWLAGFLQGDGGFYVYDSKSMICSEHMFLLLKIILEIRHWMHYNNLSILLTGKEKKVNPISNNTSDKLHNRVEYAELGAFHRAFLFFCQI